MQVHLVEFHPVQPWIGLADKSGTVTVWNWSTDQASDFSHSMTGTSAPSVSNSKPLHVQVLYEAQLESGDTLGMQDAMIQRLAEKDPQYYGAQLAGTLTVANKTAAGAIKDIKFLDTDTCFWQLTQQQSMQHKGSASDLIPYLGE